MAERDVAPESEGGGLPHDVVGRSDRSGLPADTLPRQTSAAEASLGALTGQSPIRVVRRPGQQTAALRQELAEKAAATDELREALDELRQVLDVDSPPTQAAGNHRRIRLLLAVGAAVVIAGLVYFTVRDQGTSQIVSPASSARPSAVTSQQTSTPAVAAAGAATTPMRWAGTSVLIPPGLTTTGPGADTPGTDVQISVDSDRTHLDVFERLRLGTSRSDPLVLTPPSLPAVGQQASVTDLKVELDGAAAAVTSDGNGSWTVTPPAGGRFTAAVLRYRLANGLITFTPAAPGRAFALVTPLTGALSQARGSEVVVRALDPQVLGVSCPAVDVENSICGTKLASGWSATIPATSRQIVLFQVNTRR